MLEFESKYFNEYYGENPSYYDISFVHYNIDKYDDLEELEKNDRDLKKVKEFINDSKLFKIYFSNVDTFLYYLEHSLIVKNYFDYIYLRINSVNDLEKLNSYNDLNNLNVIVELSNLSLYDNDYLNKYNVIIQIDYVSELSLKELSELRKSFKIKQIIVGQICYLDNYFIHYLNSVANYFNINSNNYLEIEKHALISNDNYTLEEYIKIYNCLLLIVNDIDINDSDIDKFIKIYEWITKSIKYDYDGVNNTKLNNQNLFGGLFNGTCVCEGYSKILQQLLSLVGIESVVVGGGGKKDDDGHIWNQVKIDSVWYNVDSSYDSIQVQQGKPFKLCLVDDETLLYKTNYPIAKKCNSNYSFDKNSKVK